jgi:enoyl-CoA hydratase/carnithine racemase
MESGPFEQIVLHRAGSDSGRSTIVLNRPAKLNALTDQMVGELRAALSELDADRATRVVIIKGEGRAFSAGFDMTPHPGEWTASEWRGHLHHSLLAFLAIWQLNKPVVAQVHGPCLGGAFEMVMACDMVIASTDAFFGLPEVRFGGLPMFPLLPWLVGMKPAKYITLSGERVSASEAQALQIVNKVVPLDELDGAVSVLCDMLVRIPEGTLSANKGALNRVYEMMGMMEAIRMGEDLSVLNLVEKSDEARQFRNIARRDGVKAAMAWLSSQFETR